MLKDLIKVANKLDQIGLTKEADLLDSIIQKSVGSLGPKLASAELKNLEGYVKTIADHIWWNDFKGKATPQQSFGDYSESLFRVADRLGISPEEATEMVNKELERLGFFFGINK